MVNLQSPRAPGMTSRATPLSASGTPGAPFRSERAPLNRARGQLRRVSKLRRRGEPSRRRGRSRGLGTVGGVTLGRRRPPTAIPQSRCVNQKQSGGAVQWQRNRRHAPQSRRPPVRGALVASSVAPGGGPPLRLVQPREDLVSVEDSVDASGCPQRT